MGCQGAGIEFVGEASEVIPVLLEDAARAAEHATDALVGRHPRWVLQAHVASRLVCGGRKMHLRTHLLLLESPSAVQLYYHRRHEVRVAFASSADAPISDRNAQITNGAGGSSTLRCLLRDMPELCGVEEALEAWLHAFLSRLAPQLASNRDSPAPPPPSAPGVRFSQWAFAALDIMLDERGGLWLLEVNRAPGAPAEDNLTGSPGFRQHLILMAREVFELVVLQQQSGGDAFHHAISHPWSS